MSLVDEKLDLVAEGPRLCTRFRAKDNDSSVYLRLDPLEGAGPVFVKIIGRSGNSQNFENYTYYAASFPILAGRKYLLYNTAPPGTEVRLEFEGPSAMYLQGVWSPDSVWESGCITIGPEYKMGRANTRDEPLRASSPGEFTSPFREKFTSSSVYVDLRNSAFRGVVQCKILGKRKNSDEIANCTNKAPYLLLESGKRYELYNTVNEDGYELAAVSLSLKEGDKLEALWSPDYVREAGVVAVGGGNSANTSDTSFAFTVNGKAQTEPRSKTNSTSVYLNVKALSGQVILRVFGVGGEYGTRNETYKCDSYVIDHPGKFMLYNNVKESKHHACYIEFEGRNVRVEGVWSPDSVQDSDAVNLGASSTGGGSYRINPVSNPTKLINVEFISQQGIPTGCESVSATMVLRFFNIDIRPYDFITRYLPKMPFESRPDPNSYFVGNPYSTHAFGCFAPCLTTAIKKVVNQDKFNVINTTGRAMRSLCAQFIDSGTPVIVWATMGMRPTKLGSTTWVIKSVNQDAKYKVGETFKWPGNEHCLVLVGYNNDSYIVNDPLAGIGSYPKDVFEARFAEQGSQSIVVTPVQKAVCYPQRAPLIVPAIPQSDYKKEMNAADKLIKGAIGAGKVVSGIGEIAAGCGVAAGTGGIAAVGGAVLAGFGAANVMEGVSDIVNACAGKDERGVNPVRDYLFMGNQEFYDVCDFALSLGVGAIEKSLRAIGKPAVHFASPETAKSLGNVETWWIREEGQIIYGRKYGKHALERMAPNTPEVRHVLEQRYMKMNPCKWEVGTKEFKKWSDGLSNYVQPRNIPAMVVEDVIMHEPRLPNIENGVKCADKWRHSRKISDDSMLHVIVNAAGDVITVMRERLK